MKLSALTTISQSGTSFVYDAQGNVAKMTVNGASTVYVDDIFEAQGANYRKYYWFEGRRLGLRQDVTVTYQDAPPSLTSSLYFLLADHLGSSSVIIDNKGLFVRGQKYYPFGQPRLFGGTPTGTLAGFTDREFTGHQKVSEFYNMQARFYDPAIGRFLQPDSIVPDMSNPQTLNRYSYVTNNPLRYTDPTGHRPFVPDPMPRHPLNQWNLLTFWDRLCNKLVCQTQAPHVEPVWALAPMNHSVSDQEQPPLKERSYGIRYGRPRISRLHTMTSTQSFGLSISANGWRNSASTSRRILTTWGRWLNHTMRGNMLWGLLG